MHSSGEESHMPAFDGHSEQHNHRYCSMMKEIAMIVHYHWYMRPTRKWTPPARKIHNHNEINNNGASS